MRIRRLLIAALVSLAATDALAAELLCEVFFADFVGSAPPPLTFRIVFDGTGRGPLDPESRQYCPRSQDNRGWFCRNARMQFMLMEATNEVYVTRVGESRVRSGSCRWIS